MRFDIHNNHWSDSTAPTVSQNCTKKTHTSTRKTHQGNRKSTKKRLEKIKILTVNTRGVKSKTTSIENTLSAHGTHIAAITETNLQKREKINIKGFEWVGRERTAKQGGGIGFLIRNDIANITEVIENEPDTITEMLWIEVKTHMPTYIGVIYGMQENEKPETLDRQYQEMTTQINKHQQKGQVIIMGDFNAKLEINKQQCIQNASRNGQRLKELLNLTRTTAINTLETHIGTWTRENRNKQSEKSVIDYIIISEKSVEHVTNSETDDMNRYPIKGNKRTDHNVITATIRTNIKPKTNKIKKWKKGDSTQWEKFNQSVQRAWNNTEEANKTYNTLEVIIKQALKENIGEVTINVNQKYKVQNDEIKEAKAERKRKKKEYEQTCKTKNGERIKASKEAYMNSQIKTRRLIEKETKTRTIKTINKIIEEGGANSTTFWRIRKRLTRNRTDEYDTKDEEGNIIQNPKLAKEHIANYFENLYTAREEEEGYQEWTEAINQQIKEITQIKDKKHQPPIDMNDINKAIQQLKKGKSNGPDNIPNEALINANHETRKIYLETINKIYDKEEAPQQWLSGEIVRLYKGKGIKGQCKNERGITLASNVGKMYERIVNNKITPEINITDNQGGGQKNKATADHLTILNSTIKQAKTKKKDLHIAFMDVTKAYDKAWLNAILYTMYHSGIEGKIWRVVKDLNTNLKAKIKTKHGPTREITITDSIRQGGVLSVVAYSNLIDEISKEITKAGKGKLKVGETEITGCLLWMDDVVLIHDKHSELQQMLNTTHELAQRFHIKFGKEKSQTLKLGKGPAPPLTLGEMNLDKTDTYKYLGMIINEKGNMEDHIKAIKGKVEASLQTILNVAGYNDFNKIQMQIIWKLVKTCIIPIITYGAEAWIPTKKEIAEMQKILDNSIKRILETPITTPSECLQIETGIDTIEAIVDKKQILYYHKKMKEQKETTVAKIMKDTSNVWTKQLYKKLEKYNLSSVTTLAMTKNELKKTITERSKVNKTENLLTTDKTKVNHIVKYKNPDNMLTVPAYMNQLTRRNCASIFAVKARMIKVKGNYKNAHNDLTCRWCNNKDETQEHIMTECTKFKNLTKKVKYETIMSDTKNNLRKEAKTIQEIIRKINENT